MNNYIGNLTTTPYDVTSNNIPGSQFRAQIVILYQLSIILIFPAVKTTIYLLKIL